MSRFVPKAGSFLTILLPGESLRAVVHSVPTPDAVIVEIATEPMAKSHRYKLGEILACRREKTPFGEDWVVAPMRQRTLAELEQEEIENAARTGKLSQSHQQEYRGDDKGRPQKKSGRGGGARKRKKASKSGPGGSGKRAAGASGLGRTVGK